MSLKAEQKEEQGLSRQRGENILKEGTACAKAPRFESSGNEENVPFATHAESKPATPTLSWTVYHEGLSGLITRVQLVSVLHGIGSSCRRILLFLNRHR